MSGSRPPLPPTSHPSDSTIPRWRRGGGGGHGGGNSSSTRGGWRTREARGNNAPLKTEWGFVSRGGGDELLRVELQRELMGVLDGKVRC